MIIIQISFHSPVTCISFNFSCQCHTSKSLPFRPYKGLHGPIDFDRSLNTIHSLIPPTPLSHMFRTLDTVTTKGNFIIINVGCWELLIFEQIPCELQESDSTNLFTIYGFSLNMFQPLAIWHEKGNTIHIYLREDLWDLH